MPASSILVVVVDGLRASALGAYGNTTYPTPALDEFATESLLFDGCFAPSSELNDVYRALWLSEHPARSLSTNQIRGSLPSLLRTAGYRTTLVTDDRHILEVPVANDFEECTLFKEKLKAPANEVSQTNIGKLFGAAAESILNDGGGSPNRSESPRLIWVHSRGMYGPWDAPLEFQASLLDEETSPLISVDPPQIVIGNDDDPDTTFRYTMGYAAQVMVLDLAWRVLMDAIDETAESGESWSVMFIGSRGFPLGENGIIGGIDSRLTSAQLHVPWMVRFADHRDNLLRNGTLVSHLDLMPSLLGVIEVGDAARPQADGSNLFQFGERPPSAESDSNLAANDTAVAIRTSQWCFRKGRALSPIRDSSTADEQQDEIACELFVRPDDRWEANNVSKLCPEVIEELDKLVAFRLQQLASDSVGERVDAHQ